MDHVGIVVEDLDGAKSFFVELGLKVSGGGSVEGDWVDRIVGLEGVRSDIAMVEAPDGRRLLELVKFHSPPSPSADPAPPANTRGLSHLCFALDDLDEVITRLRAHGAELVGEVEEGGGYRLCYIRGPEGIIVELAESIG
jgi:catechol 2,3-dioxygenase-like lactoylglutathione lyase family enzyme